MNLRFRIDQKRALSMGINAPNSTAVIDIDPALLPDDVRRYLAQVSPNGFDCTGAPALLPSECTAAGVIAAVRERLPRQVVSRARRSRQPLKI